MWRGGPGRAQPSCADQQRSPGYEWSKAGLFYFHNSEKCWKEAAWMLEGSLLSYFFIVNIYILLTR